MSSPDVPLAWWGYEDWVGTVSVPLTGVVGHWDPTKHDASPGRRLRVFAALVTRLIMSEQRLQLRWGPSQYIPLPDDSSISYPEALALCAEGYREMFSAIPLYSSSHYQDPSLHEALQDLADEITEDTREALAALDDPNCWYPGIDEGIEPVPDEHVAKVIAALQRELDRELRDKDGNGSRMSAGSLPAAPLSELPWNVQRALAERRRWRYAQYGIRRAQWEARMWSLWDIPEDPDFVPRRQLRMGTKT